MCLDVFLELVPFHFRTYCFLALFLFLLPVCFFSSSFSPLLLLLPVIVVVVAAPGESSRPHARTKHTHAHTRRSRHTDTLKGACVRSCVSVSVACAARWTRRLRPLVFVPCAHSLARSKHLTPSLPPHSAQHTHTIHTPEATGCARARPRCVCVCVQAPHPLPPSFLLSLAASLTLCVRVDACVCVCTRVCLRAAVPLRAALGACRRARPSGCKPSSLRVPSPSHSSPHTSSSCPPALSSSPSLPPHTHTHPSHGSPCHSRL